MRKLAIAVALLATFANPMFAQNPIVGTWSLTAFSFDGKAVEPTPRGVAVYTAEGHFIRLLFPAEPRPVREMTKEELLAGIEAAVADYGTYEVVGNKLTRTVLLAHVSQKEVKQPEMNFRVEGDTLIITYAGPGGQTQEGRYSRVK
jgi:hypothetical protein